MIQNIKALIVVLGLTLPIWFFARRLVSNAEFIGTFNLRRNTWLLITIFAFLSPSIWIYALFAVPVMVSAGRKDPNPAALFVLLMFAVPPGYVDIPSIFVNQLFSISHQRLLCFSILFSAASRINATKKDGGGGRLDSLDILLLSFFALGIVLFIPYEDFTNTLRRAFLLVVDTLIVYYVISRLDNMRGSISDCLSAWMMAGILMAPIAMFETFRQWLLYTQIPANWGSPNELAWLMRGSSLRAQAALGHSLTLGAWLAMSWGFFLYGQRDWSVKWIRYAAGGLLLGGLAATLSRGPWLTALLVTIVFLLMDPRGAGQALKGIGVLILAAALALLSPWGGSIIDLMPFVGTVDSSNVQYRQRLFEVSVSLIERNPLFGDPLVIKQMESLRQGQGIIDLMNGYIQIALFNGLVGLSLFAGMLCIAVVRVWLIWRRVRTKDVASAYLGAALVAAMVGTSFFIATASYEITTFLLIGLCANYWRVVGSSTSARNLNKIGKVTTGVNPRRAA